MSFYPDNLKDWVDIFTKALATLLGLFGGGWGLYEYFRNTRLRAAETILKMEKEFRNIAPIYEEIDDAASYQRLIKPILDAERQGKLDDAGLQKLTQLDRCLRFLYLCSVLNEALRVDRTLGLKEGALQRAYYYYIGTLLPEESHASRPELFAYTRRYYPLLTGWVDKHKSDLIAARQQTTTANKPLQPTASGGS